MLTVLFVLFVIVVTAFICAIASAATTKVPLWVAVVLLAVALLTMVLPAGK